MDLPRVLIGVFSTRTMEIFLTWVSLFVVRVRDTELLFSIRIPMITSIAMKYPGIFLYLVFKVLREMIPGENDVYEINFQGSNKLQPPPTRQRLGICQAALRFTL